MKKTLFYFIFVSILFPFESSAHNKKNTLSNNENLYKIEIPAKSGLINNKGEIILETDYDEITQLFFTEIIQQYTKTGLPNGFKDKKTAIDFFSIKKQGKYGIINKNGKVILKPTQNYLESVIKIGTKYFFKVQKDKKMELINENGDLVLNYDFYEMERTFPDKNYQDLATFSKDGMLGVINSEGKIILEPIYDDIKGFENKKSNNFFITKKQKNYLTARR